MNLKYVTDIKNRQVLFNFDKLIHASLSKELDCTCLEFDGGFLFVKESLKHIKAIAIEGS